MVCHHNKTTDLRFTAAFVLACVSFFPATSQATQSIDGGALPTAAELSDVQTNCGSCHGAIERTSLTLADQTVEFGTLSTSLGMLGNTAFTTYTSIEQGAVSLSKMPEVTGLEVGENNFDYCILDATQELQDADSQRGIRNYNCDTVTVTVSAEVNAAPTVAVNLNTLTLDDSGENSITVTTTDSNDDPITVTASSSDEAVASVSGSDPTYIVAAVSEGTATITFTASDDEGATASATVQVTVNGADVETVTPTIISLVDSLSLQTGQQDSFTATATDSTGNTVAVTAESSSASVASVEGPDASGSFTVTALDVGNTVITLIAGDGLGATGSSTVTVNVVEAPPATIVYLTAQQGDNQGSIGIISEGLGEMQVSALPASGSISDFTYDWSGTSSELLDGEGSSIEVASLIFNPDTGNLSAGTYNVQLNYMENGVSAVANTVIVLIEGIGTEAAENFTDSDNDGYPLRTDDDDDNAQSIQLSTVTDGAVFSSADTSLSIGKLASLVYSLENYADTALTLDATQFQTAVEMLYPSLTVSLDSGLASVVGVINLEVRNAAADATQAIIHLPSGLPSAAEISTFLPLSGGWQALSVDGENQVSSAASVAGTCPALEDAAYISGLNDGADCLQLSLADGGANDTDGTTDGVLRLLIDVGGGDNATSNPSTSITTGGGSMLMMDLAAFLVLLLMLPLANRRVAGGLRQAMTLQRASGL